MKKIIVFLLFSVFAFCGELKIATYNVENLFDGENNGNEYIDFRTENGKWNEIQYRKKLKKTANEIKAINADIIALQEIENEKVLSELAKILNYEFYAFSTPKTAPVGVAVLSHIPIKYTKAYRIKEIKTRDILRVDFNFNENLFSLYVVHLLSPRNPLSDRQKNLASLVKIVKNKKNSIVLGDFNTGFGKKSSLNELLLNGGFSDLWAVDECAKSKILKACKSHESGSVLDHVLLSDNFFGNVNFGYQNGSYEVIKSKISSDHFPLSFVLTTVKNDILSTVPEKFSAEKNEIKSQIPPQITTIEKIYGKTNTKNVLLKECVVTFKDKYGFTISQNGKGVFVYGNPNIVEIGEKLDIVVQKTKNYKKNFEINEFKIEKNHGKIDDLTPYILREQDLRSSRSGDVISEISGVVKDKIIITNFGNFPILSQSKLPENKKVKFKNVLIRIHDGQKKVIAQ